MILYFSGTGNTKFVADYLADHLQDGTINLADYLKNGRKLQIHSDKSFIFASPIYAWRWPAPA